MSSRNPNSVTSGSSSPSPNSGENRENIEPQREEIQAGEKVTKEEEQSAADSSDSAKENPLEEISKQENPDEKIPKPENPDEKIPEEEDPEEQIPKLENDPYEEMTQEEDPEEENPEQENHTFEQNRGIGSGELDDPAIAEIFTAIPGIKRIRIRRPEHPAFDLNREIGIVEPENPTISDIFREPENSSFEDTFGSVFTFETNWGSGNREQENPTTAASIPLIETNSGTGTREPENPTIIKMFASIPPIELNKGDGIIEPDDPTITETLTAIPGNKRLRIQRRENTTIDASFDSRSTINPNRGFTIRDPQNPTNNPTPAAVPEQQDKGKDKDENLRQTKICKCSSECFLFPRSTSEEEDDIITLKFVSVYRTNQGPLPSASSPEHFGALSAFISSQLPQGESISLDSLEEKLDKLLKKYLRLLRQRDISLNFEALATNYDRDLYRLGREVWGNANAQGYRFPGGNMGTCGANGDCS